MAAVSELTKKYVTGVLATILESPNTTPNVDSRPIYLQLEEYVSDRILLTIYFCLKRQKLAIPIEIDNNMLGTISVGVVEEIFNSPMMLEGVVLLSLRNGSNQEVLFSNNGRVMSFGVFATHLWTSIPDKALHSRILEQFGTNEVFLKHTK